MATIEAHVTNRSQVLASTGKENTTLIVVMASRLVLFGTPNHHFFTSLFKDPLRLMLQQKIKPSSWKWQILPQVNERYEEFDYENLNNFSLTNWFPDLKLGHMTLELEKIIFRTPGINSN